MTTGILGALAFLVWAFLLANLLTLGNSDPAGNALSQAYAVFTTIALSGVLVALVVAAGRRGAVPGGVIAAGVVLVLLSGAAMLAAQSLLRADGAGRRWPIGVPALAPLLVIGFAVWSAVPAIRAAAPGNAVPALLGAALLLLVLAPWPSVIRGSIAADDRRTRIEAEWQAKQAADREETRRAALAKLATLGPDTPLWEWMELADSAKGIRSEVLERIRALGRRQADAEMMVTRGYGNVIRLLPELALEVTPGLCAGGRKFLDDAVAGIRRLDFDAMPFDAFAERIEPYLPTMGWLAEHGCELRAVAAALETEARRFGDSPHRAELMAAIGKLSRS